LGYPLLLSREGGSAEIGSRNGRSAWKAAVTRQRLR
jgi:hypothetical protein